MSATAHFSIKYDGPALAQHTMDVRELAPALIALSNLLEDASKTVFPDGPEVRVNVQGNFKGGSFGIDLIAVQSIKDQLVGLLSGPGATAAANLFAILSGLGLLGAGGVIGLVKLLRGRRPSTIRTEGDKVVFELIEAETTETIETDLVTGKLFTSKTVRSALSRVVKPLEREGIDTFSCGDGKTETVVTKNDAPYFEQAAGEAEVVSDTTTEGVLLQIESAVFKEGNKWRFNDGAASFYAEIADADFLARINSGQERFGMGDVLIVSLRRVQSITDNGLKLEYIVAHVREHRAPLQATLIGK